MSDVVIDFAKPVALALAIGIVAFIVAGFVLLGEVDFGPCMDPVNGRRGRTIHRYACSPHLLGTGWRGSFVFVWLWSFPAAVALPLIYRFSRKHFS